MKKYLSLICFPLSVILFPDNAEGQGYLKKVKLSSNINSPCDELAPVISEDGNTLYFCRSYCATNTGGSKAGQDIYVSQKDNRGNWAPAVKLPLNINNVYDNAPCALSKDNTRLYILNNDNSPTSKSALDLSYTDKKGDTIWSAPQSIALSDFKFKKGSFFNFTVSRSGKHLIISRFAKDSTDAEDLFISHLGNDGKWSIPQNMGAINTKGFETSPFLADNDSVLYFSTNGRDGFGDGDIYMSKRLDESWTNWSDPVNLGSEVNTKGFDGYFNMDGKGNCFFTSGESETAPGDIYYTQAVRPFSNFLIKVYNQVNKQPIAVTTITCGIRTGKKILGKRISADGTESFRISAQPEKYFVTVHAAGFIAVDELLDVNAPLINKDTSLSVYLAPIKVGQKISLNHIYFNTGQATLTEESFIELDNLVELLEENPNMEILIGGHTDNTGSEKINISLSEKRVKAVDEYLVGKGINTKRIKYKGYGSSKPIASNKTPEGRDKNRRVEFVILKN